MIEMRCRISETDWAELLRREQEEEADGCGDDDDNDDNDDDDNDDDIANISFDVGTPSPRLPPMDLPAELQSQGMCSIVCVYHRMLAGAINQLDDEFTLSPVSSPRRPDSFDDAGA